MVNTLKENQNDTSSQATELASLVGMYFSKHNFRELLQDDFKLLKTLKKGLVGLQDGSKDKVVEILDGKKVEYGKKQISKLEALIKKKQKQYDTKREKIQQDIDMYIEGNIPDDIVFDTSHEEIDIEALLNNKIDIDVLERIRELYAHSDVRELYQRELASRKEGFELLKYGNNGVSEITRCKAMITRINRHILGIKIRSFITGKSISPVQIAEIKKLRKFIAEQEQEISDLLTGRETATAHRLSILKGYKRELETSGFINFPSRQYITDEVIEELLVGENVLLSGPTGTGKTVLAIQALENLNISHSYISGKSLADDLREENARKNKSKTGVVDDFAMVLSGHSGVTVSDFIVKPALKGEIETTSELGKLLKAFVDGKVPIVDEIDLIPNDILMRVKHLFTLKPGNQYAPQEDGNTKHTLHSTGIIATANIKSEKHPDREELDPAIVRLFKGVQVPYLGQEESYDLALAKLMEKPGFIYDVDIESLGKDGVVYNLIKSLKEIEESYLGKGGGLTIRTGGSDKSGVFLRKAVLEIGNFVSMFTGFKESGLPLKDFIKKKIVKFVSNGAYPTTDRLILIKIFSTNALLLKGDIGLLTDRIVDMSQEDIEGSLLSTEDSFTQGELLFIDPYQLANIDPYEIRNLHSLDISDATKRQQAFMINLAQKAAGNTGQELWDEIADISDEILKKIEQNPNTELPKEDIQKLGDTLGGVDDFDTLKDFEKLGGVWSEVSEPILKEVSQRIGRNDTTGESREAYELSFSEIPLENEYVAVGNFSEGFARVTKDGKWGFIDKHGELVIHCQYDFVGDFSEGLARVLKGNKRGFIDTTGNEVVDCIYNEVGDFSGGFARVTKDGKWGFIDKHGELVIPCEYDGGWSFSEGFAKVKKDDKYGFIDTTGKEVVSCIYDDVWDFSEGFAIVQKDGKYGFVDTTGNVVISCTYEDVGDFSEGFAIVRKDGKYGFVDTTGEEVVSCTYDAVGIFSEGFAGVKKDRKWGFIDTTGNEVVSCTYDAVGIFSEGFAIVQKDDKYGFVDTTGDEVVSCTYDEVWDFSEGFARVQKDDKYGFVDTTGDEVVSCTYDEVWDFSEGFAKVKKDGKYGFVDTTGNVVIDCEYDYVGDFSEGFARVQKDGKYGFVDTIGEEVVIDCEYDYVGDFSQGCIIAKKGDQYCILKKDTKKIEAGVESTNLTNFIVSKRRALLEEYKNDTTVTTNGAKLKVTLSKTDQQNVAKLDPNDIQILSEKNISIQGEDISVSEVTINGTEFIAIQVPTFLKGKPFNETHIGKQLAKNSDLPESFLEQKIATEYIVYGKTNAKDTDGKDIVNILAYDVVSDTDVVRECAKKGFVPSNILYEVILGELILRHDDLGEEYVNYTGDKGNTYAVGHEEKREYLEDIKRVFGIDFNNDSYQGYVIWDYGVYKNKAEKNSGFFRGNSLSATAGIVSLAFKSTCTKESPGISFRPSL